MASEMKMEPLPGHCYQHVDGLRKIFLGLGEVPQVSFLFDSAEKAQKCAKEIKNSARAAEMFRKPISDYNFQNFVEVTHSKNLSNEQNEGLVLSYQAKQIQTVGKPITSAQELIQRLGVPMMNASFSKELQDVPIIGVYAEG